MPVILLKMFENATNDKQNQLISPEDVRNCTQEWIEIFLLTF